MIEKEVVFTSDSIQIAGTIAVPDKGEKFPAVVLIPGSGMVDRDESHKKMPLNVFRDIAVYLAEHDIATFRYDKRGVGVSGGSYWQTGFYDNVADAKAALSFLKAQDNIVKDKVFLLGHSEGAYISTRLAGEGIDVAGVILLAGGAQTGEATLKWQAVEVVRGMRGFRKWLIKILRINVSKSQQKTLDKIKKSTKDVMRFQVIAKLNAKWFREFLAYDPAEDLPKIKVPVLAMTGEKDIQVDPEDLKLMAEMVKAPFEYHILSNVTHLLRAEEGEASISDYKELIKRPMDPGILQLILAWLQRIINQ